uniref:Uncharacterized protein n=1 Tax=Knipowitschia caucasica TaxID=637954 RepID=A0AAV2KG34_KNICA
MILLFTSPPLRLLFTSSSPPLHLTAPLFTCASSSPPLRLLFTSSAPPLHLLCAFLFTSFCASSSPPSPPKVLVSVSLTAG